MGWFTRKRTEREAGLVAAMATAFATALGSVLTAQTEGIKQQGQFLNTLQDLSARKAAQVLGSRGGKESAKRKKAARSAPGRPLCALCDDPMRRGVTLEMIALHRQHESRGETMERLEIAPPQNGDGEQ